MIIKIFQTGTYPQGRWDMERVRRLVDAYDPENDIEAPCVIGHDRYGSEESEFSHGWVRSLLLNEQGEVWADVEASEDLRKWVATRKLGYVSIGILADDERDDTKPPRLAHVAFLGRTVPQIKTTQLPSFYSDSGIDEKDVSVYRMKIRRDLRDFKTKFSGDGGGSRDESEDFRDEEEEVAVEKERSRIGALEKRNAELEAALKGERKKSSNFEEEEEVKERSRIGALEKRNAELEAALKEERKKSSKFEEKRAEDAVYSRIERLISDGRVVPERKDKLAEAAFSVGPDKREDFFSAFENSLGPVVSEGHFAQEGASPQAMGNDEIRAFAAEKNVDFETAVEVLRREGRLKI